MRTVHSAMAVGAIVMIFGAAAGAAGQETIPYLEREAPKDTILKGCVTRDAAAGNYVLTNIARDGETTNEAAQGRLVVLSGADADLGKHVGHRVSVTGAYIAQRLIATDAAWTREKPAAADDAGAKKPTETFRVTSLTLVADSCSHPADEA